MPPNPPLSAAHSQVFLLVLPCLQTSPALSTCCFFLIHCTLGTSGTYGAAAGDISPDISGGKCYADIDTSLCSGLQPQGGYSGPGCPKTNCGLCYQVTNQGGFGGASVGGVGNSVVVQIIDSCPAESAYNFCKTDVPAQERCGDSGTNSLDIDQSAYQALTGTAFGSVSQLQTERDVPREDE